MEPKMSRIEKGKSIETPIEYNRVKFTNAEAKLRFAKAVEINKIFVVKWGLDFEVRQDYHFEGIIDVIAALR